jgi:hypothetical protein
MGPLLHLATVYDVIYVKVPTHDSNGKATEIEVTMVSQVLDRTDVINFLNQPLTNILTYDHRYEDGMMYPTFSTNDRILLGTTDKFSTDKFSTDKFSTDKFSTDKFSTQKPGLFTSYPRRK